MKKLLVFLCGILLVFGVVGSASALYYPTMPALPGETFGTAILAGPTFDDGYHYDDPATPAIDERDIPENYTMPSPMSGYTAGDALDYHWVWVNSFDDYVIWDMVTPVYIARVYPSQDHGPYTGPTSEFDEYDVYGSMDMSTWVLATQLALYYDDIDNVRTHDGVKDYGFEGSSFRYVKLVPTIDTDFEIDAVSGAPVPEPATMLLLGSGLIGLIGLRRKFKKG